MKSTSCGTRLRRTYLIAQAEFPEQIYSSVGDFRTFYLFFDVTKPPFDQLEVRQAFSHAIDRDAIEQQILGPAGMPAYSWLAPGFPAANGEALSGIQNFDPAKAKELFSAAGFADPSTFPAQVLQVREPKPIESQVAQACAAMLRENLGITVEVQDVDQDSFMDALTAKPTELPFGFVSYGMDFVDPYNMLSVWLSGGRHSWVNEEFDQLVREAASFIGDPAERRWMFQDAERILVEDVPGGLPLPRHPRPADQTVGQGGGTGAGCERHHQHPLAGLHDDVHGAGGTLHR